jgi:polyhydroxyalkanoate synthesis regulator phasin
VDGDRNGSSPARGPIETALLAGLGWASMTAEAADDLADDLARRVGIDRDDLRRAVQDVFASWRRDAERAGLRREEALDRLIARFGIARTAETSDLALRVAQLEHRVRLLEGSPSDISGAEITGLE